MTPESVTIVLPLPGGMLSPNYTVGSIGGRFARAGAIKKYKRLAKEAIEAENIENMPWGKISVSAQFYHKANRRRDVDNAIGSLKPVYDGIVDAGLVIDDDYKHLERQTVEFLNGGHPRVELTITRLK